MLTAATSAAGTQGSFGYQPATSESFSWDDRGLLLSAAGTAGTTSYGYNSAGQETSVADAAGTSSFTYDSAGRLATDADAASGTTGSYSYNSLDQVTQISHGTGNDVQSFGYDALHRVTSDTIATASSATVASIGYGYDANSNVTSMTTTGLAVPGGGTGTVTNTYGYDQANRLTSWTATPSGGTATNRTYGYDNNGNLVSNNGVTQTYDARNELTSDSNGNSYTYAADGNLAQQNGPGNAISTFTADAYGQQITDASSSFAWDALDRVVSAGEASNSSYNVTLTYDGLTTGIASDPSATYSRDPAGQIVGVNTGAAGKTLALVDTHGDLSGTFTPAGTATASSTTWDPWGQVLASAGPAIQVGYQGQWNDPVTGQVNMGARMYRPPAGGFINKDTYTGGEGGPAVTDNLHAYAGDNPMTVTDPTGHVNQITGGGGPLITQADVTADYSRAAAAAQQADRLKAAAARAMQAAGQAARAAQSAAALARTLNAQAAQADADAAKARAYAEQWYQYALSKKSEAEYLLNKAAAEQGQAQAIWAQITAYENHGDFRAAEQYAARYGAEADALNNAAINDYNTGTLDAIAYSRLVGVADKFTQIADQLASQARQARAAAQAATAAANRDAANAVHLLAAARALAAAAAAAEGKAAAAAAQYRQDLQYHQQEEKFAAANHVQLESKPRPRGCGFLGLECAGHWVRQHANVITVAGLTAAVVGLTVINAAQLGLDPATDGLEAADVTALAGDLTAETAATTADAGAATADTGAGSAAEGAPSLNCGESFTPGMKVLLASGAAIPISQLKAGMKVLATNSRTGKTQPETIAAVLVQHDTDRYDLRIKAGGRTAVIDTTSRHLFWVPDAHRWIKAAALRYGTHLRTPAGAHATVIGGWTPKAATGWMWDLTIPGDHDFYIDTTAADVLVHNCPVGPGEGASAARNLNDLPSSARTTGNARYIFQRLQNFNGINPETASARLHAIKSAFGLGGADNVIFDLSGGVYDSVSGDYLGSLTQGGSG